ncbi:MAG TPA: GNAT family N-acetyltransferase [Steroidobacteraceae bacterium]|nr:GNAT family N-acetyltransferase [Steroidobacteraceae bacterium]
MSSQPQFVTSRLILRPLELGDFEDWAAFMADEEVARYLGGTQVREVAWRGFLCMAGAWHLTRTAMFSVIERQSGEWIGRVGPWHPEGWPGTEVGWGIAREFWGRGYATEAATVTIDWAFRELGWTDVIHCIAPENHRSQQVARRLGSRLRGSGHCPPPYESTAIEIWGQTREEWLARPQAR